MGSSTHTEQQHNQDIQDQFTRQAEPFIRRHAHHNSELLSAMVDCSSVDKLDTVLDVACGPGIVSCFFARHAKHVTGLDIVPAMIQRAQQFARDEKVENVGWKLGSGTEIPFPDASFDRVVTRFSFHHFLDPLAALREMKRVAKPGGTVLVCDVAPRPDAQDGFNRWEVLRDTSHTRALTEVEFDRLGDEAGLEAFRKEYYALEMDLEQLLASSFPKPGDADRIRALFDEEIEAGTDHVGVMARRLDGTVIITYPVLIAAWRHFE